MSKILLTIEQFANRFMNLLFDIILALVAVLVLAGAIALQQLGVADEIIIIAFGVLVGAIALTGVIAFGLGGRDVASRELSNWVDDLKKKE